MKYNTSDTKPCIIYVCDIRVLQHQLGMRENSYDIFINKCKFYWRIRQSNVRLICSFHITENCNINNYINVREYCRGNQKWTTTTQNILQQDEEKHHTICVRHRFTETNTNNINNTWALLQTSLSKKTGLCNRCIFGQYTGIPLRLHITRRIPHT